MSTRAWPEEKFNGAWEHGPHVSKKTEFIQRAFDKKWVRWELVVAAWEPQEGEHPFLSATNARDVWIVTGVWHDRPVDAMQENKLRRRLKWT